MNFNKKFDYDDINNYLPDNKIVGTSQFFQTKFKNLPSYVCDILEVKTRNEYNEENEIEFIKLIKEAKREQENKLLRELEDRENESITPLVNALDELDLLEVVKLEDAK